MVKGLKDKRKDGVPGVFEGTVARYGDRVALREKKLGLWRDISWRSYR